MKTLKRVLPLVALAATITLSGCSTSPDFTADNCWFNAQEPGAPSWKCDPSEAEIDGYTLVVGSFGAKGASYDFNEKFARQSALEKLSEMIQNETSSLAESYEELTGTSEIAEVKANNLRTIRTITRQSFSGAKMFKHTISPSGTVFVLVGVPTKTIEAMIERVSNRLKNNLAKTHKAAANDALARMDQKLDEAKARVLTGVNP